MIKHHMVGATLLELLLALAIGLTVAVMGLRLYATFERDVHAQALLANVNQIFQAMGNYYLVNCRQMRRGDGVVVVGTGKLDPTNTNYSSYLSSTNPDTVIALSDTVNTLISGGFLSSWRPANGLVDATASGTSNGYQAQFTRLPDTAMSVYACNNDDGTPPCTQSGLTALNGTAPTAQSYVVRWQAEVSVTFDTATEAAKVAPMIGGTVTTDAQGKASSTVTWKRSALTVTPTSSSDWIMSPAMKVFNMQYTNDGMAALSGVIWDSTSGAPQVPYYYLCGG